MKAVVQRVSRGSVVADGREAGAIGRGLVVLVGIESADGEADAAWMARKIAHLRVFEDAAGKMNLGVKDVGGSVLLVPNFTVAGDARKGRRPSFDDAMRPEEAEPLFERLATAVVGHGVPTALGVFRANMAVSIVNDGPITIILETPQHGSAASIT